MREIELKPSRRLGLLLTAMLLMTGVAVHLAALPVGLELALGMTAVALSIWGWRRASPIASLRVAADGRLQCLDDSAEWRDAEVLGDSFVSSVLIVLRYQPAGRRVRTLTLLPDSADADDLRRLRVSLRWAGRIHSDTGSPGAD
jgi:toxin CptA